MLLGVCAWFLSACGPTSVPADRTHGLSLEIFWTSQDRSRSSFFKVSETGEFGSSGGQLARERTVDFRTELDDQDIGRLRGLVDGARLDSRPRTEGDSGDRSELVLRQDGVRTARTVIGADPEVDAILTLMREWSLRQFRDVIDAQPQAGERRR